MQLILCLLGLLLLIAPLRSERALTPFDTTTTLPLRGLLALCIVFHHVSPRYIANSDLPYWCSPFYHFLSMGAPVVATFFFLTGYGLCVSLSRKGTDYLKSFLPRRFSSFLPEFLLLTFVMILWRYSNGRSWAEPFILLSTGFTPLNYSWFIYAIIYVYIAFFLSAKISRAKIRLTGFCFAAFILFYFFVVSKVLRFGEWWFNSALAVPLGYLIAYQEITPPRILQQYSSATLLKAPYPHRYPLLHFSQTSLSGYRIL